MTLAPSIVTVTLNPAIDQTLWVPEFAAGQVNRVTQHREDAGGKGVNVASNLADLGLSVTATGWLGSYNAQVFETLFAAKRIENRFVRLDGSTRVGIKIVDPNNQQTTDINFPGHIPTAQDIASLCQCVEQLAHPGCWFVLSGSVPPNVDAGIYGRLIDLIHARQGRVALDTSGEPLRQALAHKPDLIKPNLEELLVLQDKALSTMSQIVEQAVEVAEQINGLLAVSLGADGAIFIENGRVILTKPAPVTVCSTVGAGDAMVSGMVYGRVQGLDLESLARFATAMGTHAVTRVGSGVDSMQVLKKIESDVSLEDWSDQAVRHGGH